MSDSHKWEAVASDDNILCFDKNFGNVFYFKDGQKDERFSYHRCRICGTVRCTPIVDDYLVTGYLYKGTSSFITNQIPCGEVLMTEALG